MSGEKVWFIKIDDSALGPFVIDDLRKMLETEELTGEDLVKQHDFGAYSRVDTFEIFRADLARKKKRPGQEDLSIFIDQNTPAQKTQATVVNESAGVKAEVKHAAKVSKESERKQLEKKSAPHLAAVLCVLFFIVFTIVYLAFQGGSR
jgi:hypothetical protein